MRKLSQLLILILTLLTISAYPVLAQISYSSPTSHYSFILPNDWIEIPKSVIDKTIDELVKKTQGSRVEYAAGFQLGSKNYFSYPYILVQEHKLNTPSYSEVVKIFEGIDTTRIIDKTTKEYSEVLKNASVDSPIADRNRNILFMNLNLDVVNIGKVRGLLVMFLGKERITQLNFYAVESEYSQLLPAFNSIIDSFSYDAGYVYDPLETKKYDSSNILNGVLEKGLIGGISGGLIGLGFFLFCKNNKNN